MKGQLGDLLKQAQSMQENLQRELQSIEVTGESGGGMVRITLNGERQVRRVSIDPTMPLDDREMLEDLIAAAINDAQGKVEQQTKDKMAGMASGLGLPPGMKLPF